MTYIEKLISFHVVERESNESIITWTYPTLSDENKKHILQKCFRVQKGGFCVYRRNSTWFYIHHDQRKQFAIIVLSKEFEAIKYKVFCDILVKQYSKSRNPVELVTLYLNLCTSGCCSLNENGNFISCSFKHFESNTNLKDFIQRFHLEIILLYTAILLKRRVLVFNTNAESLSLDLLAITALVPCRKLDEYLYPLVENPQSLKGLPFFVAGINNKDSIKEDQYDLLIDMESAEISITSKAEETMAMTKTHKEIATFLVKLSTSDLHESEIRKRILEKTEDLLILLQSLASVTTQNGRKMLTLNDLKAKKFHPNLENFLFNLAIAENMMML